MPPKIRGLANPELLVWARETAGLSIEDAAKKIGLSKPDRLKDWESNKSSPTISQLITLADVYKRPLAIFYLPSPPITFKVPHDYRRSVKGKPREITPNLKYEIRRAQERRLIAIDLYSSIEESPPVLGFKASITDDPIKLAKDIRDYLDISNKDQFEWNNINEAFNIWRLKLENLGILIFHAPKPPIKIPIKEMRAFSISEFPLPAIVLNSSDFVSPRIFSMLHEFVHLLLKKEGICDFEEEGHSSADETIIEVFCNRVAGEILVPTDLLLKEESFKNKATKNDWDNFEINRLATKYKVSRDVILRRLLILDTISSGFYKNKIGEFEIEFQLWKDKEDKKEKKFFVPVFRSVIKTSGRRFTWLVLRNYHQEKITACDVSNYLDVKIKHLPNIEREIQFQNVF